MGDKEAYYKMGKEEVLKSLKTSEKGLSAAEVEKRRLQYGLNELKEKKKESVLQMFISQFKDYLILILIAATAVSALLGETTDAIVILAIVIANAIIGFIQEYNAEKAMDALKKLAAPRARVIRDGVPQDITARELVPGDIIMLEEGESIPADCRMIESMNFRVNEASLTGESVPLSKKVESLPGKDLPIGDRRNMTFTGTIATYGRGTAVVTATGMNTEMGKIAEMLQVEKEKLTPLQQKLDHFGKRLGVLILFICALVFVIGTLRGGEPLEMFITAVSLAVAAIPEGLPAVVTVTLAIGLKRMARRNALVRKLPAVETLGSATVICSDKTGTLTRNEMTVRKVYMAGKTVEVKGEGYKPAGEFLVNGKQIEPDAGLKDMLRIGMLCNNANLVEKGGWHIIGDPTEGALIVLGEKAGIDRNRLKEEYRRVSEVPFGSERKRMSSINKTPQGKLIINVKGAPEMVLKVCDRISRNGKVSKLTEKERREILRVNEEMANDALRVLAYAYREAKDERKYTADKTEKGLVFVGLVGMIDPPRKEAKKAIKTCEKAHIKVIMITGDHALTAKAIGKELGLLDENSKILTGADLHKLSNHEFESMVEEISVYARVNPEHKVRIVDALKKRGHVVAMTGDGVNDAPALRKADIGTAMGITGTDVSKEASDMILADDNFVSIVSAVEEGRAIYNNIRKFIRYLLACNSGEILVIFTSMLLNLPLPLLPIQILWMNLVTDGLPALALGMDPAAPNIMERKPRRRDEPAVTHEMSAFIVIVGLIMCVGTLGVFAYELGTQPDHYRARTISFTTLVMFQMFVVLNCRSRSFPLHKLGFFTNKHLLVAIATSVLLQGMVIYVPFFQDLFKTVALTLTDWLVISAVTSSIFFIIEIKKIIVKAYIIK